MLTLSPNTRIFFCQVPMNMRKSFEGLSLAVEQIFGEDIAASGAIFVFLNRRKDHMKILYWDGDGLVIWFKRLEKGSFAHHTVLSSPVSRRDFLMLLEGITPKRLQRRFVL